MKTRMRLEIVIFLAICLVLSSACSKGTKGKEWSANIEIVDGIKVVTNLHREFSWIILGILVFMISAVFFTLTKTEFFKKKSHSSALTVSFLAHMERSLAQLNPVALLKEAPKRLLFI